MSGVNDFYIQRATKIGWLAVAVAACLAIAALFLSGKPAWFTWGVVTGLVVAAAPFLRAWYGKRPPRKRRWYKIGAIASFFMSILGSIIGAILNVVVLNLGWSIIGAMIGFGIVVTAILSPLFESSKPVPK